MFQVNGYFHPSKVAISLDSDLSVMFDNDKTTGGKIQINKHFDDVFIIEQKRVSFFFGEHGAQKNKKIEREGELVGKRRKKEKDYVNEK